MAFNEALVKKVCTCLSGFHGIGEKTAFPGITFMMNDKIRAGVRNDERTFRFAPELHDVPAASGNFRKMMRRDKAERGIKKRKKSIDQ
ncbi:hypothetical protein [Niabella drilacis]|uniref:Uncharacterized protein n=1 Tax=Niabella drilacis (strain DSM 25811 / CCM 8410 / CCUG 62505 / LMG 26954 / E90) TaxID=1285928 RepID=A0A1G6U3Y7_NIADE|nr:hypothetical protein [Niabella drilacis]SDD35991.1 hypothetical protein SAMN04487894_108136 [Niabella drilacis]